MRYFFCTMSEIRSKLSTITITSHDTHLSKVKRTRCTEIIGASDMKIVDNIISE